jgi:hypothetical protein
MLTSLIALALDFADARRSEEPAAGDLRIAATLVAVGEIAARVEIGSLNDTHLQAFRSAYAGARREVITARLRDLRSGGRFDGGVQ